MRVDQMSHVACCLTGEDDVSSPSYLDELSNERVVDPYWQRRT